ncbi:methyltransferase 25 [Labeo rohita]|uniref:Methyltransferase 25 n=1 Tax=Labeo rohita TaxID=84645 RepID=A0A498LCI2_LABRO|nr:methyltransferase 25 [Labeo rohita]
MQLEDLMQNLRLMTGDSVTGESSDEVLAPDEFMNCKKAHEVQAVSKVVACLAKCCRVKQVIDVGSGKGYLCSYLSMRFDLQVFGIDSSSTNTHEAQERNRKLKKFSKAYQKSNKASRKQPLDSEDGNNAAECPLDPNDSDAGSSFFSMLSLDVIEDVSPRVHPSQLSLEEREKRKRENLERKAREGRGNDSDDSLFSPLTSYVTAETELKTLITELEHTEHEYTRRKRFHIQNSKKVDCPAKLYVRYVVRKYIAEEYRVKKGCVLEASRWTVGRMRTKAILKQVNGNDYGVFACKYADFLSQGKPLTFRQCYIPLFRKMMVWEIIHEKIL